LAGWWKGEVEDSSSLWRRHIPMWCEETVVRRWRQRLGCQWPQAQGASQTPDAGRGRRDLPGAWEWCG
jgi:hypothetical protein